MTRRLILALTLATMYWAMSGNLEAGNILIGLVLGLAVTGLVQPGPSLVGWRRSPRSLLAIGHYILVLAWDLIASGVQVARIVLDPRLPINPGIVAIPSECQTPLGTALSAHAITLTPGELVVEMEEAGMLYTHCLDVTDADDLIKDAQRLRRGILNRIFI